MAAAATPDANWSRIEAEASEFASARLTQQNVPFQVRNDEVRYAKWHEAYEAFVRHYYPDQANRMGSDLLHVNALLTEVTSPAYVQEQIRQAMWRINQPPVTLNWTMEQVTERATLLARTAQVARVQSLLIRSHDDVITQYVFDRVSTSLLQEVLVLSQGDVLEPRRTHYMTRAVHECVTKVEHELERRAVLLEQRRDRAYLAQSGLLDRIGQGGNRLGGPDVANLVRSFVSPDPIRPRPTPMQGHALHELCARVTSVQQ